MHRSTIIVELAGHSSFAEKRGHSFVFEEKSAAVKPKKRGRSNVLLCNIAPLFKSKAIIERFYCTSSFFLCGGKRSKKVIDCATETAISPERSLEYR